MSITMLYKRGSAVEIEGEKFDHIIVPDEEIEANLKSGWFKTTSEALAPSKPVKTENNDDEPAEQPKRRGRKQKAE